MYQQRLIAPVWCLATSAIVVSAVVQADPIPDPAFVTVIRVDEHVSEAISRAEVAAESVWVRSRSTGGPGSFSSISVRGANAGHTSRNDHIESWCG